MVMCIKCFKVPLTYRAIILLSSFSGLQQEVFLILSYLIQWSLTCLKYFFSCHSSSLDTETEEAYNYKRYD